MQIAGLQKMTLLDYPEKVACTVFLPGCNFRCPFCHNGHLLERPEDCIEANTLLEFLKKRQGILDGVCITGGEPTLQPELPDLLTKIKALGYSVKLDTNGSHPEVLRNMVESGLVDYVAMDAKNSPRRYAETVGQQHLDMTRIEESLRYLMAGNVDYELRTTLVEPLHDAKSILEMGQWLTSLVPGKKPKQLFLQSFIDRDTVLFAGLRAPAPETVAQYAEVLQLYAEKVTIRNN